MKEGDAIEHPWLSKNVERAQKKVEERNFQIRKNILEYDEVMEHQRQRFYGLRQRILEGRQVKDLVFEYIEDVVDDAIAEYLDPEFSALCAAEYARESLDCSILPDRLKGKDAEQMDITIRKLAKEDVAANISVTLGEYIPNDSSEFLMEFDSAGLHTWAKNRFGVELDTGDLREAGPGVRREVQERLEEAAFQKIDDAELPEIVLFADRNYGAERLAKWVKAKFTFEVTVEDIIRHNRDDQLEVRDLIIEKARDLYSTREAEFPVDYMMQTTMNRAMQDPSAAFEELAKWARNRAGMELPPEKIKTTPPAKMREQLIEAMRTRIANDDLSEKVNAALATDSEDDLDAYLKSQFDEGITERMRYLEEDEREDAVRARVETLARPELVQFEQMVLIETLDQSWKDHLYAMDQLRDSIGFRAIAQTDPKIEYKREGQRMFKSMMKDLRERVTDIIFKARIAPQRPQQGQRQPMQRPRPQQAPAQPQPQQQRPQQRQQGGFGNIMGSSIMGPGISFGPSNAPKPAAPAKAPEEAPKDDQSDAN
jgi:preprotein translocase subunit SecA